VLNRRLVSVPCRHSGDNTAKTHPDTDSEQSLGFVIGACESLHDQDVDAGVMTDTILALGRGELRRGLADCVADVYGIHQDDIMDYIKMASSAPPPVLAAFKGALVTYRTNYYRSLNAAFLRFSQDAVRSFPQPQLIGDAIELLRGRVGDDAIAKIKGLLGDFKEKIGDTVDIGFRDVVLLTKFSKYYKLFVRQLMPEQFLPTPHSLANASVSWPLVYELRIRKVIDRLGLTPFDEPVRMAMPGFDQLMEDAIAKLGADVYPVADGGALPVRKVKFMMREGNVLVLDINAQSDQT
jgi:hypothetical protein